MEDGIGAVVIYNRQTHLIFNHDVTHRSEKVPNPKFQVPEKLQAPIRIRIRRRIWCFEFGISLELETWDLELFSGHSSPANFGLPGADSAAATASASF